MSDIDTGATAFTAALGIRYPIVQGPMNGGSPIELVTAVSNAGGLGSFAAALLSPAAIIEALKKIRSLTSQPFNVNLFILQPIQPSAAELDAAQALLLPDRARSRPGDQPAEIQRKLQDQLAALLEAAPPVVSFTFGILDAATVAQFQHKGCKVIGTATNVAEARAWEQAGAEIRQTAAKHGRSEFMSLWAGQGVAMSRPLPAAQLVATLATELLAIGDR